MMTKPSLNQAGLILVLLASIGFSGCATQSSSGAVYTSGQAQREQIVRMATVESVREITIDANGNNAGVGTLAGAAVGGIGGSSVGGGKGAAVAAVLGAVAGGVAGQALENQHGKKRGFEITVKLDNGELRAIAQEADEEFRPGDRVRLLTGTGVTRVTH
ncbi:glycine zipper domain-containing protein [Ampullimonas aquatilis]|uniref:glycine zipper domain-containing protein n=1 Tax=Ampullimonas aquatilis TaxID=1341549 RepID=UPI003C70E5FE